MHVILQALVPCSASLQNNLCANIMFSQQPFARFGLLVGQLLQSISGNLLLPIVHSEEKPIMAD
jgi:hypothetical protein